MVQGSHQGESLAVPSILGERQESRGNVQPVLGPCHQLNCLMLSMA